MKKKRMILLLIMLFIGISSVGAETATYSNFNPNGLVSCGNKMIENIPSTFPKVISIIYTIIQIVVPIILVILGSIDLIKGITSQKDEEIKKGQQTFVKRLIAAVFVFLIFLIVKLVISVVADNSEGILDCAECFIKNECD